MKWLSYTVIGYMLLALMWWSVLLYRKNQQLYETKIFLLQAKTGVGISNIYSLPEYEKIQKDYTKQTNMILGEALVFGLSLMIGLYLINRAFQKELAATKRQNNFLLSVTHELKSPLTSIKLGLETLKKRSLTGDMVQDITTSSLQETDRLQKLIDQLLFTAKVDTSSKLYNFQVTNVSRLVNDYIDKMQSNRPDLIIIKNITEGIHAKIDIPSIETAISNLVENAIKYANDKSITLDLQKVDKALIFKVSDEGIGIPQHEKKHIFTKFYRIGSEETRKTKGTGLGLYICKKVITDHGGTVSVEDNVPKGSVFIITLPIAA
jgi:signal transduction histidine kinase